MYKEDFESERKDRENLHARLIQKEEELATNKKELQSTRQRFEEELQTKNQQVKHLHILHSICTFVLYMYCVHVIGCVYNCGPSV